MRAAVRRRAGCQRAVAPGTISGPEGSASVGAWLAGATVYVALRRPAKGCTDARRGGAAIRLDAERHAAASARRQLADGTAGAVYARADGGFEVAGWLHLGLRAVAGAVPSGVTVQFAGNDAAVWGRPFLAGMLLVDLAW